MNIDVSYTLNIIGLHTSLIPIQGFSDVISQIEWRLTAYMYFEDKKYESSRDGITLIDFDGTDLDEENFVSYENLTEEELVSWVHIIDPVYISKLKSSCRQDIIDVIFRSSNKKSLPWNVIQTETPGVKINLLRNNSTYSEDELTTILPKPTELVVNEIVNTINTSTNSSSELEEPPPGFVYSGLTETEEYSSTIDSVDSPNQTT